MNILINGSCLHNGGGLQVAESLISFLKDYPQHHFVLILSDELTRKILPNSLPTNCTTYYGNTPGIITLLNGRYKPFDDIAASEKIECVLTVFGPSRWKPDVPHLCGFARPHLVMKDSVFFKRMNWHKRIKEKLFYKLVQWSFDKSSGDLFTENELISERLRQQLPKHKVWTVTNNYNQMFDNPQLWESFKLPSFDGLTMLCITAAYPHKNLEIAIDVARDLKRQRPEMKFRFVFTVTHEELQIPEDVKEYFELIGRVSIVQCPSLYQQADIMFLPTLLECFSATYAEAMRMGVPIITTDLDFARGLCKDAALYYNPLDATDAGNKIIQLAESKTLQEQLIVNGKEVLKGFDTAKQRADKLIRICEKLANNKQKQ